MAAQLEASTPLQDSPVRAPRRGPLTERLVVGRLSAATLLAALVLHICAAPFVDQYHRGRLVSSVLMTVVAITATLAMGSRRWTFIVAVWLVVPTLVARWSDHIWPGAVPPQFFSISGIVFVTFVVANLFGFILRAPRVSSNVLCAGVATYLLIGLLWAFAYTLVASSVPDAFSFVGMGDARPHAMEGFTAIYFSFITMTSVGYGDIIPLAPAARMLAMIEAMAGMFYMAVMIARLVALHTATAREPGEMR